MLTTASLARLARAAPGSRVDVRRFRPNLLIETERDLEGYVESDWAGRKLRVGALELECTIACPRCVMITHGFDDLPKDPALMRAVVRDANQIDGHLRPRARRGDASRSAIRWSSASVVARSGSALAGRMYLSLRPLGSVGDASRMRTF